MNHIQTITQAYSQTPWRKQVQLIGYFLLVVVVAAIIAGLYLNVTAETTAIGREIQAMQVHLYGFYELNGDLTDTKELVPIEELEQNIASLRSELAFLTSYEVMYQRARDMGLEPVDPEEIVYLEIAGYTGPETAVLAPPPQPVVVSAASIDPAFRQSLFDWVGEQIRETLKVFNGVEP
jgi:cell division protein FtsL